MNHVERITSQRGVALAVVVWFIAGMSLLVAGIVAQARVDTRMTQLHIAKATAMAAGDGAIQLMMVDTLTGPPDEETPLSRTYRLGGQDIKVFLTPISGLIDLNAAPVQILAALFYEAGGLSEQESFALAENLVAVRGANRARGGFKLSALEDLLRVPGSSRAVMDAVRDLVIVSESSGGATNWSQAPEEVLAILARADPTRAESVSARRDNTMRSNSLRSTTTRGRQGSRAGGYRADAIVRYGDQLWLRRRWIALESGSTSALPWRFSRTEAPRVIVENIRFQNEA